MWGEWEISVEKRPGCPVDPAPRFSSFTALVAKLRHLLAIAFNSRSSRYRHIGMRLQRSTVGLSVNLAEGYLLVSVLVNKSNTHSHLTTGAYRAFCRMDASRLGTHFLDSSASITQSFTSPKNTRGSKATDLLSLVALSVSRKPSLSWSRWTIHAKSFSTVQGLPLARCLPSASAYTVKDRRDFSKVSLNSLASASLLRRRVDTPSYTRSLSMKMFETTSKAAICALRRLPSAISFLVLFTFGSTNRFSRPWMMDGATEASELQSMLSIAVDVHAIKLRARWCVLLSLESYRENANFSSWMSMPVEFL